MRSLLLVLMVLAGCKNTSLPVGGEDLGRADGGSGDGGSVIVGDPDLGVDPNACNEPDGSIVILHDVSDAKKLLPGRWGLCSRSSDTFGPWSPASFGGVEYVEDDSVAPGQAGSGRWYFLARAADGTVQRGQGFDVEGSFVYNPFPATVFEEISMSSSSQYASFYVAFTDGPRKLSIKQRDASWAATFAPLP